MAKAPCVGLFRHSCCSCIPRRKNCTNESVCNRHCKHAFMKHVLPKFCSPTKHDDTRRAPVAPLAAVIPAPSSPLVGTDHDSLPVLLCPLGLLDLDARSSPTPGLLSPPPVFWSCRLPELVSPVSAQFLYPSSLPIAGTPPPVGTRFTEALLSW